ncbi:hypothetical protein F2Q68_00036232 [Brassica cretica]|uniref:Uncharacterized protein n=1 Tax=Brassica cretica TaxID=69181 RepID=A0A8S9H8K2_BRACR|nr:hypothetical protein F2Q68_00036232 [Brassica cretica]
MLKAQINILELDQPSTKTKAYSIDRESDQEVLALKRAMTEQERVRKEAEAHVQRLSDLLAVETDRSRLLESQLTENHKKVRMLSAGTATLDHILTLGQCPSLNIGLGYKGSTSKATETKQAENEAENEVKDESEEDNEPEMTKVDLDQGKVHKNHSSSDVIGGIYQIIMTENKEKHQVEGPIYYYMFNTLLFRLLVLYIFWWVLIYRMLVKHLQDRGKLSEDVRSDSESDDDHED